MSSDVLGTDINLSVDIILVLSFLVVATVFFAFEWLSIDVVTLGLLCLLVLTGVLSPDQVFAGFASETIIILGAIFVISGALVKTGIMEWSARVIYRISGRTESRILGTVMTLSACISAFVSNTSSTAVLMPAAIEGTRRARVSASRILMPLAYASILGGTCTLIGTSTNLAASGFLDQAGLKPISLFEFTPIGLILAGPPTCS